MILEENIKQITKQCTKCLKFKYICQYTIRKDTKTSSARCKSCVKEYKHEHYIKNKSRIITQTREYRQKNLERDAKNKREYSQRNKETVRVYYREYCKNKRENDPYYQLVTKIRARLGTAFKFYSKNGKTRSCAEYGVDFNLIFEKLGPRPDETFVIDHIIPLYVFDLDNPEHVRLAHLPINLRWFDATKNTRKHNYILPEVLNNPELVEILKQIDFDFNSPLIQERF